MENEVKPALWAIHYHGKVQAPEGNYRFVGFADNVIVVRINSVVVFDGGWTPLETSNDLHQDFPFRWSELYASQGEKASRGLLKQGITFHMDSSDVSDMDVLIGDDGGLCAFYLMVMNVDHTYDKLPDGTPKAPFFQLDTGDAPKFKEKQEHPPYSTTPEPWQNAQSIADP